MDAMTPQSGMLGALSLLVAKPAIGSAKVLSAALDASCLGYNVSHVVDDGFKVEARLDLVGDGCGVYGPDVALLTMKVEYQGGPGLISHEFTYQH